MKILLTLPAMVESPRGHDDRLWLSDWGAQEIIAVDPDGNNEVAVRVRLVFPFESIGCDGRLLVVLGCESLLLRKELNGSLVTRADLRGISNDDWTKIVVEDRGDAHFNFNGGPGIIALVTPDELAGEVDDTFGS